jgi:TldD protein
MRNTYMLAGPHEPKQIMASVKKGIYAEHFTNGQGQYRTGRLQLLRQKRHVDRETAS